MTSYYFNENLENTTSLLSLYGYSFIFQRYMLLIITFITMYSPLLLAITLQHHTIGLHLCGSIPVWPWIRATKITRENILGNYHKCHKSSKGRATLGWRHTMIKNFSTAGKIKMFSNLMFVCIFWFSGFWCDDNLLSNIFALGIMM